MCALAQHDIKISGADAVGRPTVHIGVLALQGDFQKHLDVLEMIDGVEARTVRTPGQVGHCDGLIIPGGESTTVGKLMAR